MEHPLYCEPAGRIVAEPQPAPNDARPTLPIIPRTWWAASIRRELTSRSAGKIQMAAANEGLAFLSCATQILWLATVWLVPLAGVAL